MVMELNKGIFRVMKEHKGVYLGMFYMVLLSSLLFVFFALTAINLNVNKNAYFEDYVQGDLEFYAADKVQNITEIEQRFELKIEETLVRDYSYNDKTIRLFTPNEKVNIAAVLEGKLPTRGEIALDPQFANANDYKIGDSFYIDGKAYTISGYIALPNYAYIIQKEGDLANNFNTFGIGVLTREDLTSGNLLYSVKFERPQDNIYEQARPLKAFLNEVGVGILSWNYAKYDLKTNLPDVETLAITAYSVVLPPFLMFLTALLVAVVLGRMVKSQMNVVGTLYALGYRKKEIMRHYMRYPLILGVSGGIIGGVLGVFGVRPMLDLMFTFLPMPISEISYNPIFIVLGTVITTAILYIGAYIALNKLLKKSPVSMMKNKGKTYKPNFIEKRLQLGKMKFEKRFSIREQLRSLPRLAFLIVGVLAATFLIMFGLIMKSSLDYLIDQKGNDTMKYSYEYVMNKPQTEPPVGGESVAGLRFVPHFDVNSRFEIVGARPGNQVISLVDTRGNMIELDDSKVVISKNMAKKYKLDVGEIINFTDIYYDKDHSIEITHIADTSLGDVIFVSLDRFNEMIGWEKGSYNAILTDVPLNIDESLIYAVKTPEDLTESLADYMILMNIILYGIAVVAAIIGLIIMFILASISIDENKGNISLMKVFGYKKKEINALIVNGSRMFVIFAFAVGVPLAFFSIGSLLAPLFDMMKLTLIVRLDWYFVLLGFVLIYFAFEISKTLTVKKIAKVSMSEALKSQKE